MSEVLLIDMVLDAPAHQLTQLCRGNRIKLHRGAGELLRPGVRLLSRARRQIPLLHLFPRNRWTFEVDLGTCCIPAQLGLDVAGSITAGGIQIAKVVDVGRLVLRLDFRLRNEGT